MFITNRIARKGGSHLHPTLMNMNSNEEQAFGGNPYTSRIRGFDETCGFLPVTVMQDEILTPGEGQIRAMVVSGCNPLRSYTHAAKMETLAREMLITGPVTGIRGRGLLLGLETRVPAKEVCSYLFQNRILAGTSSVANVARLMPPLIVQQSDFEQLRDALAVFDG